MGTRSGSLLSNGEYRYYTAKRRDLDPASSVSTPRGGPAEAPPRAETPTLPLQQSGRDNVDTVVGWS